MESFTFNPVDKIIELYEALVKSEKEKVAILQKIIGRKKIKWFYNAEALWGFFYFIL